MTQVFSSRGIVLEMDPKHAQMITTQHQQQVQQQQQQHNKRGGGGGGGSGAGGVTGGVNEGNADGSKQQQELENELEIPPPDRGIMKMWNSFPVKCILSDEDIATLKELNPSSPLNDTVVEFIVPRQGFLFLHRECILEKFGKLFTQSSVDDMWFTSAGGRIVRWQTPLTTLFDIRLAESVMSDQAVQASLYSSPSEGSVGGGGGGAAGSGSSLSSPTFGGRPSRSNPRMRSQHVFRRPEASQAGLSQSASAEKVGGGGSSFDDGSNVTGVEGNDVVDQLLPLLLYVHIKPPPAPKKTDPKELKESLKEKSEQMLRVKDERTGFEIFEQLMKQSLAIRFGSLSSLTQLREKHEDLYVNLFLCVKNNLPAPYLRARYVLLNCMSETQSKHYPVIFHINQKSVVRKVPAEHNTLGKLLKQYVPEFSALTPQDLVANREALLIVQREGEEVSETVVVIQGVIPFLSTPMDQLIELCMCVDLFLHVVVHTRVK